MKRLALLAALVLAGCDDTITGIPEVIDGDSLRFGSTVVRLAGIDAPELDQTCIDKNGRSWPCGHAAKLHLWQITRKDIHCFPKGQDHYGRTLADCGAVNVAMVLDGYALNYGRYTDAYRSEQIYAMTNESGIWSGTFQQPEQWRREHPRK